LEPGRTRRSFPRQFKADAVALVLDEGRVLDSGRHEELYERCDLYRRLCDLQFVQPDTTSE